MEILYGIALSAHLGLAGNYNSLHPHVRLENNHYIAGVYYNSMDDISVYGGLKFDYEDYWIETALVTGYDTNLVIPYVRVGKDITNGIRLFAAPAVETYGSINNIGVVIGIELLSK